MLKDKALPSIRKQYLVDENDVSLFGHSLAGLFALSVFLDESLPVQRFVVADPSIWWNGHQLLAQLDAILEAKPTAFANDDRRVDVVVAGRKVERPGIPEAMRQRIAALRGGPNGKDFANRLAAAGLRSVTSEVYVDESHGSVIAPALAILLNSVPRD